MNYIRGKRDIPLMIITYGIEVLKLWIDSSYEVHQNIWGHTDEELSIGRGFPILTSTK